MGFETSRIESTLEGLGWHKAAPGVMRYDVAKYATGMCYAEAVIHTEQKVDVEFILHLPTDRCHLTASKKALDLMQASLDELEKIGIDIKPPEVAFW